MRVLAAGNTIIDTVMAMPQMPVDDKVFVDSKGRYVGGQGANAAQGMALLGLDVSFLTRVGDDIDGRFAKQHFEAVGLDTTHCFMVPGAATMSACVVVSTAVQQRSSLIHSDAKLFGLDLSARVDGVDLRRYDTLYTDGHQMDLVLPLVRRAAQCGMPIVADLEVLTAATRELAALASELIAPARTLCALAGRGDPREAAVILAAGRPGLTVVATAGAEGSYGARHYPRPACSPTMSRNMSDYEPALGIAFQSVAAQDISCRGAGGMEAHGPVTCRRPGAT